MKSFLAMAIGLALSVTVAAQNAPAQRAQAGTPRVSAVRVPITFAAPRGYAATVDYLKKVAAANPGLTELTEIGKSAANRPIHVLVISNMKTGVPIDTLVPLQHPRTPVVNNVVPMKRYQAKPGQWIDGGTRGADPAGAEGCLYIIDKLLSGYGSDPDVTTLVDDHALYICPIVNPDAPDSPSAGTAAGSSALANDNFPEGWWTDDNTPGGTGDFPSSLPEARAVLEFFTNHTNILLVQSFDATGGFSIRPFARWPDARVDARDTAILDGVLGKKYQELAGQAPASRVWRSAYNSDRQAPAGFGVFVDWAYGQFGAFAMSTQISSADAGATLEKAYERAWQFERFKGSLLPRVQFKSATANVLYTTNQATKATVSEAADAVVVKRAGPAGRYRVVQVTATVENVGPLPTQVARGTELRGNRQDVVWLLGDAAKVTFLEGSRWMAIGVLQGTLPLPRAAGEGGRGARGGAAGARGGGRGGRGEAGATPLSQMREQRPAAAPVGQSGSSRTVSWLVAVDGDAPLKLVLTSQRGGTIVQDVVVQ
ncbi:MAG: M14 family zinc carboxypeptidase [Acidobacteria bacterium]|nr:M14 family zinc carboxypeptidase [Acidobacteriota bacterium]